MTSLRKGREALRWLRLQRDDMGRMAEYSGTTGESVTPDTFGRIYRDINRTINSASQVINDSYRSFLRHCTLDHALAFEDFNALRDAEDQERMLVLLVESLTDTDRQDLINDPHLWKAHQVWSLNRNKYNAEVVIDQSLEAAG